MPTLTAIMMTSGATATHTGHSGRRLSCSMHSSTTMATGIISRQSSSPPMSIHSVAVSLSAVMLAGRYHRCPAATMPKNAAVHRRSLSGVFTRRANALPCLSKRYRQAMNAVAVPAA